MQQVAVKSFRRFLPSISIYIVRFYKNTTFGFIAEIATGAYLKRKNSQNNNIT